MDRRHPGPRECALDLVLHPGSEREVELGGAMFLPFDLGELAKEEMLF
ncbi:hypothetical protein ABZZ79_34975 [Streptomyces sp. NPDC006458]